jgi:hypothetical protein
LQDVIFTTITCIEVPLKLLEESNLFISFSQTFVIFPCYIRVGYINLLFLQINF